MIRSLAGFGRHDALAVVGLAVAVLAIYLQTGWFDFTNWDDPGYVYRNNRVREGLVWANVGWAFTSLEMSNWHPLTWVSYLLDSSLFGAWPGGYHLVNVFWHLLASLSLYAVVRRFPDGSVWRAAVVALLFAVHPLHVESVAWISERKDVLSVAFGLLAIYAYQSYARLPGWRSYGFVVLAFAFSLMAKPMLVTLPALLLVMDYWPLRRLERATLWRCVLEKLPLLILALAAAALTIQAQAGGGAVRTLQDFPLGARIANVVSSYAVYFVKHLWPSDLAFFHVMNVPSAPQVAMAALLLATVSGLAWWQRVSTPAIMVGWLWFLGTLVPVIGLVQVGDHGWASRYSYFPSIGLFIAVAWLLPPLELAAQRRRSLLLLAGVGLALLAFGVRAFIETGYWKNSDTIYQRALAVNAANYVAHTMLAEALVSRREWGRAEYHALQAIEHAQGRGGPSGYSWLVLSNVYMESGRLDDAAGALDRAERLVPKAPVLYFNRGTLALMRGMTAAALPHFEQALKLNPRYSEAHNNRGAALARLGRLAEAVEAHRRAIHLDPFNYQAQFNLGAALAASGQSVQALAAFDEAARLAPRDVRPQLRRAALLRGLGRHAEARAAYQAVLVIEPANPIALGEAGR